MINPVLAATSFGSVSFASYNGFGQAQAGTPSGNPFASFLSSADLVTVSDNVIPARSMTARDLSEAIHSFIASFGTTEPSSLKSAAWVNAQPTDIGAKLMTSPGSSRLSRSDPRRQKDKENQNLILAPMVPPLETIQPFVYYSPGDPAAVIVKSGEVGEPNQAVPRTLSNANISTTRQNGPSVLVEPQSPSSSALATDGTSDAGHLAFVVQFGRLRPTQTPSESVQIRSSEAIPPATTTSGDHASAWPDSMAARPPGGQVNLSPDPDSLPSLMDKSTVPDENAIVVETSKTSHLAVASVLTPFAPEHSSAGAPSTAIPPLPNGASSSVLLLPGDARTIAPEQPPASERSGIDASNPHSSTHDPVRRSTPNPNTKITGIRSPANPELSSDSPAFLDQTTSARTVGEVPVPQNSRSPVRSAPQMTAPSTPTIAQLPQATSASQIAIRLDSGAELGQVELRIRERGGEVQIAVRSTDSGVAATLREDLGDLMKRLDPHASPPEATHRDINATSEPGQIIRQVHSSETSRGSSSLTDHPHQQQQQQRQRQQQQAPQPEAPHGSLDELRSAIHLLNNGVYKS